MNRAPYSVGKLLSPYAYRITSCSAQLEGLGKVCQISAAIFRHEHHVFDAHCTETRIVETRLDRNDVAFLEQ